MQKKLIGLATIAASSVLFISLTAGIAFASTNVLGNVPIATGANTAPFSEAMIAGDGVSFTLVPSGDFNSPTYSVSDDFAGSSLTAADIDGSGAFSWTSTATDVGTHNLTFTVTDGTNTGTVTIPVTISAPCSTGIGSPLVVDVTQQISNDPDSGNFGGDWALDNFSRHIQVWAESDHYCVQADDSGTFTTFGGANGKSPQSGAALPEVVTGTMTGSTHGEITGASLGDAGSWGYTGTAPAQDCGAADCSMTDLWVNNYFSGGNYDYGASGWGWTYDGGANGTWINAANGSSGDIVHIVPPAVTTEAATAVSDTDATLNGLNGPDAASQESFWVSLATFDVSTPNIPANVYSTPVLNAVAADTAFSDQLSLVTTSGITTGGSLANLAPITPGTTYYYVAWSNVNGTWQHGAIQTVTTMTPQTITFDPIADMTYGDADLSLNASASSGLAVSFDASGTCSVAGTTLHITGAGTCDITASQAGNTSFDAAADATRSFNVAPAALTITADNLSKAYGASDPTLTASYSGFVNGDDSSSLTSPVTLVRDLGEDAGNYAITASGAADSNYSITYVPGTFTITPTPVIISLSDLAQDYDGTSKSATVTTDPTGVSTSVTYDGSATAPTNVGSYAVVATVDDPNYSGSTAGTLVISDVTPPVITGTPTDITTEATGPSGAAVSYTSPTATDDVDGTDTVSCTPLSGSTFPVGTTPVTCSASDAAHNASATTFNVIVRDTTAPVITLLGSNPMTVAQGSSLVDPGATAADIVDGDLTAHISTSNLVNTSIVGTYTITYGVSDAAHNPATPVVRTVHVTDQTAPTMAAHGNLTAEATSSAGASVTYVSPATNDNVDGAGTATCSPLSGSTFPIGIDTVTCNASDAAHNAATPRTFTITVKDTTAPAISSHSDVSAEATSSMGTSVSYAKPTATDAVDGTDSVSCAPVSTSLFGLGTTTVNCSSTDAAHNASTSHFAVVVKDTTAPVITLNGSASISLAFGATYAEQGAIANDAVDGTDTVIVSGDTVNTSSVGTYTITYNAQDAAGNHAAQVTRSVSVSPAPSNGPVSSGGGGGGGGSNGPISGSSGPAVALPNNGSTAPAGGGSTGGLVLGASVYEFKVDFGIGAQGTDVTELQKILTQSGFFSSPSIGSFGPMTKTGVKKFQTANNINPTGYVGPLTRAVLNKGSSPTLLQELQSQLAALMAKLAGLQTATSTATTTPNTSGQATSSTQSATSTAR